MKGNSYFNEDQQEYMRELSRLPADAKCKCGWYLRGKCPHCKPEDGGKAKSSTGDPT